MYNLIYNQNLCIGVGGGYSLGHENRNAGSVVGRTRPILCSSQSNQQLSRSRTHSQQHSVVSKLLFILL